jgi:DNA-binding winged helix-turn-helix (wHTH) protein
MPGIYRFGVFEANEATGELRKHGVRVKLHAQPFQVLAMLLERAGEVVTRQAMRERLWGDGTFVDFESGLNTAVNKIREALNDSAGSPRYVETVPGKGYRFIGTVTVVDAEKAAEAEVIEDVAPRKVVRALLILIQAMYLAFYFGALGNLAEIHEIFEDANWGLPASTWMGVLVTTAVLSIPVRLFLLVGVIFDFRQLGENFRKIFPVLLVLDLLWALAPFLLVHHLSHGVALGMTAALVYVPFAQRSLVGMYGRKAG